MVGSPRAAIVADDDEFFHTTSLLRLAGWGLAAAASVAVVVFVARTDLGVKRFQTALAAIGAPPTDPQQIATVQLAARIASAERDARRAIETAQSISSDRERMSSRVIAMEHEIAELTGAVRRAAALAAENRVLAERKTPAANAGVPGISTNSAASLMYPRNDAPGWTPSPAPSPPAVAARPPETERPPEPSVSSAAIPPGAIVPLPRPTPLAAAPAAPAPATNAAASGPDDAALTTASVDPDPASPKAEFGADLGPALTMARLRARWAKLAGERPDLVKGMRPLVTVRDTGAGKPVEVRLLVGPMATVAGATDFCKALTAQQYLCRPAVFDGQRLTVQ